MRMARHLDFGVVWINFHIPLVAEMPQGGFRHSGAWQGPVHLRLRGLHLHQEHHEFHRFLMSAPPRRMGSDRSQ
jgi:hypothetical protein